MNKHIPDIFEVLESFSPNTGGVGACTEVGVTVLLDLARFLSTSLCFSSSFTGGADGVTSCCNAALLLAESAFPSASFIAA